MRLPKITDLDKEQSLIYSMPLDTNVFVSGPPGCGKTVIACHRAMAVSRKGIRCRVIMYTKVLAEYTGLGGETSGMALETSTQDSWVRQFWRKVMGTHKVPNHFTPGQKYHPFDYMTMQTQVVQKASGSGLPDVANWGHLVIDEGQDFSKNFYAFLNLVAGFVQGSTGQRPVLTVLADENQRITNSNSTLKEIRSSLRLEERCWHKLTRNYRNTKRIAAFANQFSVGLETGTGTPVAERDGEFPRIVKVANIKDSAERIVRYANNHPDHEVGVFVQNKKRCKNYYNRLKAALGDNKVQAYISGEEDFSAKKLKFTEGGRVTVLCYQSAKGLEFDAVFLPELHDVSASADNEEIFKMTMFVMCTRARGYLELLFQQNDVKTDSVVRWLPLGDCKMAKHDDAAASRAGGEIEF